MRKQRLSYIRELVFVSFVTIGFGFGFAHAQTKTGTVKEREVCKASSECVKDSRKLECRYDAGYDSPKIDGPEMRCFQPFKKIDLTSSSDKMVKNK